MKSEVTLPYDITKSLYSLSYHQDSFRFFNTFSISLMGSPVTTGRFAHLSYIRSTMSGWGNVIYLPFGCRWRIVLALALQVPLALRASCCVQCPDRSTQESIVFSAGVRSGSVGAVLSWIKLKVESRTHCNRGITFSLLENATNVNPLSECN